jgi:hypothetical protein
LRQQTFSNLIFSGCFWRILQETFGQEVVEPEDMTLSNTVTEEFRSHLQNLKNLNHGVDLSERVLITWFWPGQNAPPPINLPRILSQAFDVFKNFYLAKHSGRILTREKNRDVVEVKVRENFKHKSNEEYLKDPRCLFCERPVTL